MDTSVHGLVYIIETYGKLPLLDDLCRRESGHLYDGESYVFFIIEQISEISSRYCTQQRAEPLIVASLQFVLGTVS